MAVSHASRKCREILRQTRPVFGHSHTRPAPSSCINISKENTNIFWLFGIAGISLSSSFVLDKAFRETVHLSPSIVEANRTLAEPRSDSTGNNVDLPVRASVVDDASTNSSIFQLQAALEFKEEMQKLKMARFLRDLTELAAKKQLRKFKTAWPTIDHKHYVDLHGMDLAKLTTEEALYILDEIHNGEALDVNAVVTLCKATTTLLRAEPTLLDKTGVPTVTVVGDLHGSLPSLKMILEMVGDLDDRSRCLVFDGDFVDRGDASLEVFLTLLLLKIAYPNQVALVRGNHEDSMVAKVYGFADELQSKYGLGESARETLWKQMSETFAALPLGVVTDTAFIAHGGLPSKDFRLDHLRNVTADDRCKCHTLVQPKTATEKMIESLLWSDPTSKPGIHPSPRGTGVQFGSDVARNFLMQENLQFLVRGHEPIEGGVRRLDCGEGRSVITVFSAANYPNGEGHNVGAILELTSDGRHTPIIFNYNEMQGGNRSLSQFILDFAAQTEKSFMSFFSNAESLPSKDKLRTFVREHLPDLANAFSKEEGDGLITKEQWASVMESVLDLHDVAWQDLQPQVAPTTEPGGVHINWREYLLETATDIVIALSDKDKMEQTVDHMDKMLAIFEYLDFNKSGVVEKAEFVAGTRILNRLHLSKKRQIKDPDALFAQFDDDGNGVIDLKEFREHLSHSHILSTGSVDREQVQLVSKNHEILTLAFEFLDTDKSGSIDLEEWKVGIELLNKQLGSDEKVYDARELFRIMDVNASGSITLEDFNRIFGSLY